MKEELYIDVVSKTIISQLAESIAQVVGTGVSKEIKTVLLTNLPGVIEEKIVPVANGVRKNAQEAAERSENRILDQFKETQEYFLSNSDKTDAALNNLESFIKTELIQIQDTLTGSLGKKHYDLHDRIVASIKNLVQDLPEPKVDVGKLQSHSNKVIEALNVRVRDLEKEIKAVLLTNLPGVIGEKIVPVVNGAWKSTQEAAERSENRILDQLKETQGYFLSNSDKVDAALNNLESFIKTELIQVQDTLTGSLREKHYDLHDRIVASIKNLVQDLPEPKVDIERLQSQSNKVIDALGMRVRDLEKKNAELLSSLNESVDSGKNLWMTSQKEIDSLNAGIDGLQNEKVEQELHITRSLASIDVLTNQMGDLNEKLKEKEVVVENAMKIKVEMEKKLIVIQELWEKQ